MAKIWPQIKMLSMNFVLLTLVQLSEQSIVNMVQGKIRGTVHDGYISYMGIPYASITDDGRFKNAGLAPIWSGVRNSYEPHCSAVSVAECLQLDVHVPAAARGHWPVLAWVAGGPARYNVKTIVQEDVVVVVVHHRVGPSGFLCTKDETIPGNAAAKDIVLALRWVQDNIVAFKGNPAKVIIAGQSVGAALVEAVTLSPMSKGLFHGVILQSGSILSPWAFNYDANERAIKLAHQISNNYNHTMTIQNAKIEELVDKTNKLDVPYIPFGICIEKRFNNQECLLTEAPYELLANRKVVNVPMIIGYNNDEAYIFASILKESNVLRSMSYDMTFLLPQELKFLNEREKVQMGRQVEEMYFKSDISMRSLLTYHRDAYFINHIYRTARFHASSQPVYFYQFSHNSDLGVQSEPSVKKVGAAHSDELALLFSGRTLEGNDEGVQKKLVKLWTNFVKYLNPSYKETTSWDTLDPAHPRLLDISTELKMMEYPFIRTSAMWDDVYSKYYYTRNSGA